MNSIDIEACLIKLYFNPRKEEKLIHCVIRRSYRDLNRTIHGISKLMTDELSEELINFQITFITDLFTSPPSDQKSFDRLHEQFCNGLINKYKDSINYNNFQIGQAQKWINMSLKYMYVLNRSFPKIQKIYKFLHVPIDQIILTYMREEGIEQYTGAWSKVHDYNEYLSWQVAFRKHSGNVYPIEFETELFNRLKN